MDGTYRIARLPIRLRGYISPDTRSQFEGYVEPGAYFVLEEKRNFPNSETDPMATKLDKTIKRELEIDGQAYMISIMPTGVKMTKKGFRNGPEMSWKQILASGENPS